jgi:hypothetical protein
MAAHCSAITSIARLFFGDAVAFHEWVDDHDVDLLAPDGVDDGLDDGGGDGGAASGLSCQDDRHFASAVAEQGAGDVLWPDLVMHHRCLDPAIDFIERIFAIPVPDAQPAGGFDAE